MLDLLIKLTKMNSFTTVEQKENLSYQEFVQEYLKKRIPVVFKNASSAWKSNTIFTPSFFSEKFGDYKTWSGGQEYTMNEILNLTEKSTAETPAPYPILFEIPKQLPELMQLFKPLHMNYARPNWFSSDILPYGQYGKAVHLFIGGKGNQYSLHNDAYHTNAWVTQLYGQKKFIVFPHGQDEYLYAGKTGITKFISPINILNPDYEKYPDYKKATPIEVVLNPGDTIFIPNGVWHTTVALGQNITLIVDQLNKSNFKAWKQDIFEVKKNHGKFKAQIHYAFANSVGNIFKAAELFGARF